jgi:hypothetical protein
MGGEEDVVVLFLRLFGDGEEEGCFCSSLLALLYADRA